MGYKLQKLRIRTSLSFTFNLSKITPVTHLQENSSKGNFKQLRITVPLKLYSYGTVRILWRVLCSASCH